jgi:hypothetical protein
MISETADMVYADDLIERRTELLDELEYATGQELIDVQNEIEDIEEISMYCSDFEYGGYIIHEDYFKDYIEQLIADVYHEVYDLVESYSWPVVTIDYEASAEDAKVDYTEVEYKSETFYTR